MFTNLSHLLFLQSIILLAPIITVKGQDDFTIEEATIESIQRAFDENKLTSLQLVDFYLHRIENLNPVLRCVLEINPDARVQAEEADRERRINSHHGRSFMHGIPVLLKDSIDTNDKMNTTAGSYALLGSVAGRDAGVVEKLRKVGAVILGKTSLTEWYSFRALFKIPNGWCARGGQAQNPYVAGGDTCGSSSGSAISVAANMVSVSLGSETHGSIICPADYNSVVGFKPTAGLTSRAGVIPISSRQDTIGPMARSVADAVHLLDAIVGFDPRDGEATSEAARFIPDGGYKPFLNEHGIIGKRLGGC
ncbi:condensin-2 complex subunit H2-like [Hibiscus syriacus]|uniref:Condensin-2 complex subunit H2-like n=1 Tax=Hibiscus syriacus TaxID=106335 RepID=A0A6A3CCX1_HIBSY|nr:condensin-2 complex subunit H2-like [Hibiscus syriacus]